MMQEMHFRLVYCIERLQVENRHGEWNSCFAATGLSELPVRDCFNNGVGIRVSLLSYINLIIFICMLIYFIYICFMKETSSVV